MFDDIPENYRAQTADNEEEGWRYTQGDKSARRPPELLTRDHVSRCIVREVKEGRGSPHGGVFLDISWIKDRLPERRRAHQEEAAEHVPPVQAARRHRHHAGADGSRADDALHHGRRAGGRRHADVDRARPVRRGRVRRRHQRRESPRRQLAVRPPRLRQARRRVRREVRATADAPDRSTTGRWTRRRGRALEPFERGARRRGPVPGAVRAAGHDAGPRRHRAERERDAAGARRPRARCATRADARRRRRAPRVQPGLARRARPAQPADRVGSDHALGDRAARRAAAATSARTIPDKDPAFGAVQHRRPQGARRRRWRCPARRFPRCPTS